MLLFFFFCFFSFFFFFLSSCSNHHGWLDIKNKFPSSSWFKRWPKLEKERRKKVTDLTVCLWGKAPSTPQRHMIRDILLHLRGGARAGWIGCEIKVWQVLVGHRQNIKDLPMSVMDVCASRPSYEHCETAIGKKEKKRNKKQQKTKQNKKETDIQKAGRKKTLHSLKKLFYFGGKWWWIDA